MILPAAMHYNENAASGQASTEEDERRWSVHYPKAKKGDSSDRPIRKPSTYGKKSEQFISE